MNGFEWREFKGNKVFSLMSLCGGEDHQRSQGWPEVGVEGILKGVEDFF